MGFSVLIVYLVDFDLAAADTEVVETKSQVL